MLPHMLVTWAAPTPPVGVAFARYVLYRNGAALLLPEDQIETLDSIATLSYEDYNAPPGLSEYQISWVGVQDGIEVESPLSDPESATLAFDRGWIHLPDHPDIHFQLRSLTLGRTSMMAQAWLRARNRKRSTLFSGRRYEREIMLALIPSLIDPDRLFETLDALAEMQAEEDVTFCARWGSLPGHSYFVQFTGLTEELVAGIAEGEVTLHEAHYGETAEPLPPSP